MDRTAELLAAVLADPDADAPRLVYADHLMSIGDSRGELVALQCAFARGERSRELRKRELELLAELDRGWVALLGPSLRRVERGFISLWQATIAFIIANGERVFAAEPIVDVRVMGDDPDPRLASALRVLPSRVRALHLRGHRIDRDALDVLATRRLRVLDLGACYVDLDRIPLADMRVLRLGYVQRRDLAGLDAASELEVLELPHCGLDPSWIRPIAALPRLRELDISNNRLDDEAAKGLLVGPFPSLVQLRAGGNAFSEPATRLLTARFGDRLAFR